MEKRLLGAGWATIMIILTITGATMYAAMHGLLMVNEKPLTWYSFGAFYGPAITGGEWWRFISSAFIEGSVAQLLVSILTLWQIGRAIAFLEDLEFFVTFLVCGMFGGALALFFNPYEVASGAFPNIFGLYGVLLGFAMARQRYDLLTKDVLTPVSFVLLVGAQIFAKGSTGLDFRGAALGGFLAGIAIGYGRSYRKQIEFSLPLSMASVVVLASSFAIFAPHNPNLFAATARIEALLNDTMAVDRQIGTHASTAERDELLKERLSPALVSVRQELESVEKIRDPRFAAWIDRTRHSVDAVQAIVELSSLMCNQQESILRIQHLIEEQKISLEQASDEIGQQLLPTFRASHTRLRSDLEQALNTNRLSDVDTMEPSRFNRPFRFWELALERDILHLEADRISRRLKADAAHYFRIIGTGKTNEAIAQRAHQFAVQEVQGHVRAEVLRGDRVGDYLRNREERRMMINRDIHNFDSVSAIIAADSFERLIEARVAGLFQKIAARKIKPAQARLFIQTSLLAAIKGEDLQYLSRLPSSTASELRPQADAFQRGQFEALGILSNALAMTDRRAWDLGLAKWEVLDSAPFLVSLHVQTEALRELANPASGNQVIPASQLKKTHGS